MFYKTTSKMAATANRLNANGQRLAVNPGDTVFYTTLSGVAVDRQKMVFDAVSTDKVETIEFNCEEI